MLTALRYREHRLGCPAVDDLVLGLVIEPLPIEPDNARCRDRQKGLPRRRSRRFSGHSNAAVAAEDALKAVPRRSVTNIPPQVFAPAVTVEVRVVGQIGLCVEEHVDPTSTTRGHLIGIAVAHIDIYRFRLRRSELGAAALTGNFHCRRLECRWCGARQAAEMNRAGKR
jgi:hypothetical protein